MTNSSDCGDDADIAHLLDLLDLLPCPTIEGTFWKQLTTKYGSDYKLEKLYVWARNVRERGDELVDGPRQLAEYCLLFFSGEGAVSTDLLHEVVDGRMQAGPTWVSDVVNTAWRICVPREATARRKDHGPLGSGVEMED